MPRHESSRIPWHGKAAGRRGMRSNSAASASALLIFLALLLGLAFLGHGRAEGGKAASQVSAKPARRAGDVRSLLGVNPDLMQGNWTSIEGPGGMIEQAKFVGAEILRVGAPDPTNNATRWMPHLVAAGLKLDFVTLPYATPLKNMTWISDFINRIPNSVVFVEGPNEPNNNSVTYKGEKEVKGAVQWQADFYALMKANANTERLPIFGMASWPLIASASDLNNLHIYPNEGDQARSYLEAESAAQNAVDPGKRWGITEFGYFTIPGFEPPDRRQWEGVDEMTQAKLLVNAYLDAAALGVTHFSIFSLRDWCSTAPDDIGAHFGLFRCDNSPKPAAIALHNIAAILKDTGSGMSRATTGTFAFGTNASPQLRSLLMRRSDGSFILAFWKTPDIWDETADRPIAAPKEDFILRFGTRQRRVEVFAPLLGGAPVSSARDVLQVPVVVEDHPVFVVIGPP